MRILAITNLYPNPLQAGRATHNRQHFRALAKANQMRVVAPISWVDEWRARLCGRSQPLTRERCSYLDGIEIVHPRYFYPPGLLRTRHGEYFLRSIRSSVHKIASEFQPEILLASWAYPDGYAAVRLASEMLIPAAVQVVGSDVNLLERYPARLPGTLETLRAADVVIAVSRDLAEKVVRLGVPARKVEVVYRGMNKSLFFPGSQSSAQQELGLNDAFPVLLFVGNLVPVKAVDVLITACRHLLATFPRLQCHIIGDGPLRKSLRAQAGRMGLEPFIRFHGTMEHNRLPAWYRAADLVVLPSLDEGIPNVLLESIACGRPYVASDTGGIPEISHHTGCELVAPGDPRALASAVTEKLRDAKTPTPADLPVGSWEAAGTELGRVLESVQRSPRRIAHTPSRPGYCVTENH